MANRKMALPDPLDTQLRVVDLLHSVDTAIVLKHGG